MMYNAGTQVLAEQTSLILKQNFKINQLKIMDLLCSSFSGSVKAKAIYIYTVPYNSVILVLSRAVVHVKTYIGFPVATILKVMM